MKKQDTVMARATWLLLTLGSLTTIVHGDGSSCPDGSAGSTLVVVDCVFYV